MPSNDTPGGRQPADERAIARKYGIRELNPPDVDQVRALSHFLNVCLETGRCPAVPRTAATVILEFLQATTIRQHITKSPRMSPSEYDALQTPYYVAARIIARLQREKQGDAAQGLYQTTWISLARFIDILRSLLDPTSPWLRARTIPEEIRRSLEALRDFLAALPEQRKKGRAT